MGPHVGMDPICMIALQAGMSGHSASRPVSLEDQIAEIEADIKDLEEQVKDNKKDLKDDVFKTLKCYQAEDNTGAVCVQRRAGSGGRSGGSRSQKRIEDRSIINDVVAHIKGNKNAPEECAGIASGGVSFYFEQFLPHLQYAGFPLKIISPSSAMAEDLPDISAAPSESGTANREATVPVPALPEPTSAPTPAPDLDPPLVREPAETCDCPEDSFVGPGGSVCITRPRFGGRCPVTGSWAKGSIIGVSNVCYADCGAPAIRWVEPEPEPEPAPAPAACDPTCGDDQRCENNSCVCENPSKEKVGDSCLDRCSGLTPDRRQSDNKCICNADSCGDQTCNNDSGQCEVVPAPEPEPEPEPEASFNWCDNCDCRYKKYFEDEGDINIDDLCEDPVLLKTDSDGDVTSNANRKCTTRLEYILEDQQEIARLIEDLNELNERREEEEDEAEDIRRRCRRNPNLEICRQRNPGMTEAGTFCTSCFQEVIDAAYPKKSGWDKLLSAVVPLAGAGMAYYGAKEANKLRSYQGFPVDSSAMSGLAYPFITSMLYGGALNGRGRNALACSPTAHQNPYGAHGHAHGSFFPGMPGFPGAGIPGAGFNLRAGTGFAPHLYPGIPGAYPGAYPGIPGAGFNLRAGFGPGAGLYPGAGIPGAGFNLNAAFGPGAGLYPGAFPGAGIPGAGFQGGFNQQYQAQLQMQQQMQSYYLQLQQFQMERQRRRQSVMMRYQQEVQSLSLKYQTYLSNVSPGPGGNLSYPPSPGVPGVYPGSNPAAGGNPSYTNPYQ